MTMTNSEYKAKAVREINNGKVAKLIMTDRDDKTVVTYFYRGGRFWTQANYDETGDEPELRGERNVSPQPLERAIDKDTVYLEDAEDTPVADKIELNE